MTDFNAVQILSRKEIKQIVDALSKSVCRGTSIDRKINLTIFRLACCCGLRVSEVTGVVLDDIRLDCDKPHISIRPEVGKGKKAGMVPLWWDNSTLEDLKSWKARRISDGACGQDSFVCCRDGSKMTTRTCQRRFKTILRLLGTERAASRHKGSCGRLSIHSARHSFCSHALAGGRSLAEVRDAARHSNVLTTSLYLHAVHDDDGAVGSCFSF